MSACTLFDGSLSCTLSFSVVQYNYETGVSTVSYSGELDGQATIGLVKNNVLYVDTFQTRRLLVVPLHP